MCAQKARRTASCSHQVRRHAWKHAAAQHPVQRLHTCRCGAQRAPARARAQLHSRWTAAARRRLGVRRPWCSATARPRPSVPTRPPPTRCSPPPPAAPRSRVWRWTAPRARLRWWKQPRRRARPPDAGSSPSLRHQRPTSRRHSPAPQNTTSHTPPGRESRSPRRREAPCHTRGTERRPLGAWAGRTRSTRAALVSSRQRATAVTRNAVSWQAQNKRARACDRRASGRDTLVCLSKQRLSSCTFAFRCPVAQALAATLRRRLRRGRRGHGGQHERAEQRGCPWRHDAACVVWMRRRSKGI